MLKELKVVFMGTPDFSVKILEMLIENTTVIGVVTQPDKVVGRGGKISYSPVKKVALEHGICLLQPERIRKQYDMVLSLNPDIIITCAYGQIIPESILSFPKYGCINVHASLLPKLRGGAPIHHAIIDGYDETGITIMYMDKGMDTGDIISAHKIPILEEDNVGTLHDKLSELGKTLLLETLPSIIDGTAKRIKQKDDEVTFAYNIKPEEEIIDFNKNVRDIFNQVRGLNPFPGAYFKLDDLVMKIYAVRYEKTNDYQNKLNGEIVIFDKKYFGIKCSDGIIYLEDLKKQGKKRMSILDYLNGEKDNLLGKVVNSND